jgi:hypothetical protein
VTGRGENGGPQVSGDNACYLSASGDYWLAVAWRDSDEGGRPVRMIASGTAPGGEHGLFELRELAPGGEAEAVLYALSPYGGGIPVIVAAPGCEG